MKSTEHGRGTVRSVRSKSTGAIVGYQALLPRELSKPARGSKRGRLYQEPIGPVCATKDEARSLLDAVIVESRERGAFQHGLPLAHYVQQELRAELTEARRRYGTGARANKATAKARSIDRCWLSSAPFYNYPPAAIGLADLQRWINYLRDEAEGQSGEPLSSSFVRSCGGFLKSVLARVDGPNLARALELPSKDEPNVRYLQLASQRQFFGSGEPLEDRIMVGCGMGPGLRVGELLAQEAVDVHLDDHDPHLLVRYGGPHHAPTKGGIVRRVELFEPGLGFWRLWMRRFYAGGQRVFAGPSGGYLKAWPEQFPGWAKVAGVERLSSHVMRHTYAVAMLSGSWGYEPRSLEFVSKQLGHADVQTTERYYGAFEFGVWQREVRRMTGRNPVRPLAPVTAAELLGIDAANDAAKVAEQEGNRVILPFADRPPSSTQTPENTTKAGPSDAPAHQAILARLDDAFRAVADAEPHAVGKLLEAAALARDAIAALQVTDREADVG